MIIEEKQRDPFNFYFFVILVLASVEIVAQIFIKNF
jgi:hypothetical protein